MKTVAATEKLGPARDLHFDSLNAAVEEAERLLAIGYERRGHWTLAQVAGHCAQWLDYTMQGNYPIPAAIRPVLSITGRLFGPRLLRKFLEQGRMAAGVRTFATSIPAPLPGESPEQEAQHAADARGVASLREAVRRFTEWDAPLPPSPLYGPLNKQEASRLHCIHMAHHFGYLVPADEA